MTVSYGDVTVEWLGYATVRLASDDAVVYLDPGRYGVLSGEWEPDGDDVSHPKPGDYRPEDGDLVCITHVHHYDPDGIRRVAGDDATLVVFEGVDVHDTDRDVERPADLPYDVVEVGMEADRLVEGVPLWTVPAYNHADGPNVRADGTPIHPEGFGCGFLVSLSGTRVFYPGDTDVLEGHAALDASVFLAPISRNYTMDRHAAADLAAEMEPDLVVPVHYDTFEAIRADSRAFAADVAGAGVPVALDER